MQKTFVDQMGRDVVINYPPKKIISVVPSQTELLFDLGLDREIVGLTKFCIHPIEKFAERTKVGGTKKLNIDLIKALEPDLIIGNKEENTQADIEELAECFPVWMSDIYTLDDAMKTIGQIGELVNREPEAAYLNHLISAGFSDLKTLAAQHQVDKKVAYLIWRKPFMAAGKNTFIDEVLMINGMSNVIMESRYPEVSLAELKTANCEMLLLSSEPYPFSEKHIAEIQQELPDTKIQLVDGEMFSWYGSRLVKAVQYFFEFQKQLY
ncbi:helical backbone metal receptor [Pedobacter rhizosphaerae]|uniref:ABC-type Fe3+-hydroxamate transport system, substrate-binding protein n=1 Tax=Pedobacter rhizosphaerae TaxID=390241 RepID=A0A1H9SPP9_9SPHI|nr:helical backbone metal receptor [Pedobacter rhizosphaerae]SER86980.1 ABC-type Fe3+-hydroxamate transport system, substrate-binding protein [Pedobacter rhizosphaerae]